MTTKSVIISSWITGLAEAADVTSIDATSTQPRPSVLHIAGGCMRAKKLGIRNKPNAPIAVSRPAAISSTPAGSAAQAGMSLMAR
jgi:hypothetical protein